MNEFLDALKPPNLNQKEVRNPKRSITNKEIEAVTKRGSQPTDL